MMITVWKQTEWGGLTALAMFLEGLCGAAILISLLLGSSTGVIAGVVAGILAGLTLLIEAGNPKAAIRLLTGLGHAWMSRGTLLITLCIVFGLAYALPAFSLFAWLPWEPSSVVGKVWGVIAGIAGLGLMLYPGLLLSSMKPFPLWRLLASPIISLLVAILSGLGLLFLGAPLFLEQGVLATLRTAGVGAIILQLLALGGSLDASLRSSATAASGARLLLSLPFFSVGVIVVGLIAPLVLLGVGFFVVGASTAYAINGVVGLLLLVGQFCLRYATLAAGIRVPMYPVRI